MFLLLIIWIRTLNARWDLVTTVQASGGGDQGDWRGNVFCPSGTWAKGFRHETNARAESNYDDTGTYYVVLHCKNFDGFVESIKSLGEGGAGTTWWSDNLDCPGNFNFIKGYQLKVDNGGTGVTGVRMRCTNGQEMMHVAREHPDGNVQSWADCPAGTAICGLDSKFEKAGTTPDDSALNDIKAHCCRLCDEDSALYVDPQTKRCELCHYSCKKCNQYGCTECFSNSYSSGSICQSSYFYIIYINN